MSVAAYLSVHMIAGWLAGKAFAFLTSARTQEGFGALQWGVFIGSISAAMLFAKFVIGEAKRMPNIPDAVVGASALIMLAVFVWTSGIFRVRR